MNPPATSHCTPSAGFFQTVAEHDEAWQGFARAAQAISDPLWPGIFLARVQDPQNINHIGADLIHHNVIRMHNQFTGARHATGPEQIRHEGQHLGRLNDGGVKILRRRSVALLDVIDDFHQVGGCLVSPPNCLHGLCGVLRAWSEPLPWPHRVANVACCCAVLLQLWRETRGCSLIPVLWSRTRKRWGIAGRSCFKG